MVPQYNRAAIIPLKPDYEQSGIHRIKHSQTQEIAGISEKTSVEVIQLSEDAGSYELLTFLREFELARATMSWTTGLKLYKKFIMNLQGHHHQTWTNEATGQAQTVATFDQTILAFKEKLLENEDYDNQMDYIRDLQALSYSIYIFRTVWSRSCLARHKTTPASPIFSSVRSTYMPCQSLGSLHLRMQTKLLLTRHLTAMRTYSTLISSTQRTLTRNRPKRQTRINKQIQSHKTLEKRATILAAATSKAKAKDAEAAAVARAKGNKVASKIAAPVPSWGKCRANKFADNAQGSCPFGNYAA
jgi:hypothetical protein